MLLKILSFFWSFNTTPFFLVCIVGYILRWLLLPKLPPGPFGLPVVGYLPFVNRNEIWNTFGALAKKYGNVFTVQLGSVNHVVLNGYEAVAEALNREEFTGRPVHSPFKLDGKFKSFGAEGGEFWREHRRFSLHILRDLGLGRNVLEQRIKEEIEYIVQETHKQDGQPFLINSILVPSMSNNIASVLFGERLDFDHPKRKLLDSIVRTGQSDFKKVAILAFMPWLIPLVRFIKPSWYADFLASRGRMRLFIENEYEEHKKSIDINNVRDYIDSFILEQKRQADRPDSTYTMETLCGSAGIFLAAGSETVRVTVEFLLYLMALHQDTQARVQAEIDSVTLRNRNIDWSDAKNLPYTQAVIMEAHRWITVTPIGLTRATTEDVEIQGHRIPKGTSVIYNLFSVHHDQNLWRDPETFQPQRFLSDDGKKVKRSDYFMPFATGKRSCPGEGMAHVEVFLYFTSFLKEFFVRVPEGKTICLDKKFGISVTPVPQELCFIPRSYK